MNEPWTLRIWDCLVTRLYWVNSKEEQKNHPSPPSIGARRERGKEREREREWRCQDHQRRWLQPKRKWWRRECRSPTETSAPTFSSLSTNAVKLSFTFHGSVRTSAILTRSASTSLSWSACFRCRRSANRKTNSSKSSPSLSSLKPLMPRSSFSSVSCSLLVLFWFLLVSNCWFGLGLVMRILCGFYGFFVVFYVNVNSILLIFGVLGHWWCAFPSPNICSIWFFIVWLFWFLCSTPFCWFMLILGFLCVFTL